MSMKVDNSSTYLDPSSQRDHRTLSSENLISRPREDKKFKVLSVVFGIVIVSLIIALSVVASKKTKKDDIPPPTNAPTSQPKSNVCYRPECRDEAARFLTIMNTDANPCEDFFDFVCGKWVNDTQIPKEKSRFGVFDIMRDELAKTCIEALESPEAPDKPTSAVNNSRALYQACANTENVDKDTGVEQLRKILKNVGVSDEIFSAPIDFDIYQALTNITKKYGLNFIISFSIGPDDMNTTNNIIALDQPDSFGLARNFLLGNESDPRVVAYKQYIVQSLCLLNSTIQDDCSYLNGIVADIYNFEVNITKMTRDLVDRRSAWTWYFKMPFSQLAENVTIDFLEYSQQILEELGSELTNDTEIIVKEETYLKRLAELLKTSSPSVQSNYLAWRLIQYFGPLLFKDFRTIKFEFDKVNEGIVSPRDITFVCFDATNALLGHAVGKLYIDSKFDAASKKDVEEMVNHLADAFRSLLDKNDWMDEATKEQSRIKLTKMVDMLGYPEWTADENKLNDYYNMGPLKKVDLLESLFIVLKFNSLKALSQLGNLNNRSENWVTQASIVNAFYNPSANSITFPAGILQIPFYGERPKYLNYGAIGYVIGHEITHGYDDQGSEFDGDGNLKNWWTDATRQEFDKRKKCFIDQYTNIVDRQTEKHLNGSQTIGENIADNGGIREAYQAYLLSGTSDERLPGFELMDDKQMFFMSAASVWCETVRTEGMINLINDDVHAPGKYRAYIPLANAEEFAEVFNCPKGSTMNPKDRCRIW